MKVERSGERLTVIRGVPRGKAHLWAAALQRSLQLECVPAMETVGIHGEIALDAVERAVLDVKEADLGSFEGRLLRVPVCYEDGEDLESAAHALGLSPDALTVAHRSKEYVAFCLGFQPGFAYLGDLPESVAGLPRLASPRLRVQAGSVGMTGTQTGVYPDVSPGGWNLVGKCPMRLVDRAPWRFAFHAGDRVRFKNVDRALMADLEGRWLAPSSPCELNADLGEGFESDNAMLDWVERANICCGEHAGRWEITRSTAEECRKRGVTVGVHPGYPDRETMGRAAWSGDWRDARESVLRQVERFVSELGADYLKPHGALYNEACEPDSPAAALLSELCERFRLPLLGLRGEHDAIAKRAGVPFMLEGYADRRSGPDGRLLPRKEPGAVIHDPEEAANHAYACSAHVDSVCVHGDTPEALSIARSVALRLWGWS